MFSELCEIRHRPKVFSHYTTPQLWNDPHISKQMLKYHLDPKTDLASRNIAFVQRSADWIVRHFRLSKKHTLCDFGCGPGLYTTRFAQKQMNVVGVDLSERSIRYAQKIAKQEKLPVRYVRKNYLDFSIDEKFDLITMIFCDFCVLSPTQRTAMLHKFYDMLHSKGHVLLDVVTESFFRSETEKATYEYVPHGGFWSQKPYFVFDTTFTYEKERVVLKKATVIEKKRSWEIFNWLQCYTLSSLQREFKKAGLEIVEHYSNVAGDPYSDKGLEMAIVAKKR